MEETVFFNLGNAIAAKRDPKELIKEAQIVKGKRDPQGKLVIVEDDGETLILFDLADQEESSKNTQPFKIKKIID
ncbi:hypothetical protein [Enterococcus xiangfangensis]|uniref:hypothetical protein n=1 Tax=Enterococcus xiangfangensis TaxID=1296537 RepID=UPI0010F5E117|nr:hypothetical protein [Enterococcus xiangfangensis]MBM7712781.1 hypothetical protein [Enterococcus xiangfangensis]NBK09845.1 hypothetical protein [Enterococcus asini]